jgi:hypothetical protein
MTDAAGADARGGTLEAGGCPEARSALKRDAFSSNRHPALGYFWSMMFSENRYPFGIML